MIKETNDNNIINYFLNFFDTKIDENPFRHYIVYDNVGILVYSLIYDRLEIDYLYVLKEYRNKHIASKLLEYLFNKYEMPCTLEVNVNNDSAINLYKKFNFEIVSIREKYYGEYDGYLMYRK